MSAIDVSERQGVALHVDAVEDEIGANAPIDVQLDKDERAGAVEALQTLVSYDTDTGSQKWSNEYEEAVAESVEATFDEKSASEPVTLEYAELLAIWRGLKILRGEKSRTDEQFRLFQKIRSELDVRWQLDWPEVAYDAETLDPTLDKMRMAYRLDAAGVYRANQIATYLTRYFDDVETLVDRIRKHNDSDTEYELTDESGTRQNRGIGEKTKDALLKWWEQRYEIERKPECGGWSLYI